MHVVKIPPAHRLEVAVLEQEDEVALTDDWRGGGKNNWRRYFLALPQRFVKENMGVGGGYLPGRQSGGK